MTEITVGTGVTHCVGSDRYPYTVVEVLGPKRLAVTADSYTRTDKNGLSESQTYEYRSNFNGARTIITLRKNGRWYAEGQKMGYCGYTIGHRSAYSDPSF